MDSVSQIQSHAHAAFIAGVNWAPGAPAQASNFCERGAPRRQCTQKERKKCEQEFASVICARHAGANEATDARAPTQGNTKRAGGACALLAGNTAPAEWPERILDCAGEHAGPCKQRAGRKRAH